MIMYMYNHTFFLVLSFQKRRLDMEMDEIIKNDARFYYESKDTFKNVFDDVHTFPRTDFECGMHMHEFFEINIITRGKGRHYVEDHSIETTAGDVFIIPPKLKHGYKGGKGFDVFYVLISDRFINKNMSDLQMIPSFFTMFTAEPLMRGKVNDALHLRLTDEQFDMLDSILKQTLNHRNQLDLFDSLARKGFAMVLIAFLCKVYSQNAGSADKSKTKNDEAFLKTISYIHENYFEKISIDTLAKISNLSRSTFLRKFNDVCKMSPSEYIIDRRIQAAEYMLLNTSDSILNIAFKCGFYDAPHFAKIFTKKRGISPTQYREKKNSQA